MAKYLSTYLIILGSLFAVDSGRNSLFHHSFVLVEVVEHELGHWPHVATQNRVSFVSSENGRFSRAGVSKLDPPHAPVRLYGIEPYCPAGMM